MPFKLDSPIEGINEDRLERKQFTIELAKQICSWRKQQTLVLGLTGDWGTGKTSIVNMLLELVSYRTKNEILSSDEHEDLKIILDQNTISSVHSVMFSPWLCNKATSIEMLFYRELSNQILKLDPPKKLRKVGNIMGNISRGIAKSGDIVFGNINELKNIPLTIGCCLSIASSIFADKSYSPLLVRWAIGLCAVGVICSFSNFLSKVIDKFFPVKFDFTQKPDKIRETLKNSLVSLKEPLLVVIDDLDRLPGSEIRDVLKLVRSHSDFHNLIYLLVFQRNIVEQALSYDASDGDGRRFLDKLVQVMFDVPPISDESKIIMLEEDLLSLIPIQERENDRFKEIFQRYIRPFLKNIREVNRLISSWSFMVQGLQKLGFNYTDLLILETLKNFEPDVYSRVYQYRYFLTGLAFVQYPPVTEEGQVDEILSEFTSLASESNQQYVSDFLKSLFPIFREQQPTKDDLAERRICHPDCFERYFIFNLTSKEISDFELHNFIQNLREKPTVFQDKLIYYFNQNQYRYVLNFIEASIEKLQKEERRNMISSLFAVSEKLPDDSAERIGTGNEKPFEQLLRICCKVLFQERENEDFKEFLWKIVRETDSLYLSLVLAKSQLDLSKDESEKSIFVKKSDLDEFLKLCKDQILTLNNDGIVKHPRVVSILVQWFRTYNDMSFPNKIFQELIETKEGCLTIIRGFKNPMITTETPHFQWTIHIEYMAKFVDLRKLYENLVSMNNKGEIVDITEKEDIDLFLKFYKHE